MGRSEDGEFELILGNKQLLSVFFIVVVLLGVFFTMGYIVGKNSVPADVLAGKRDPIVVDPTGTPGRTVPPGGVIEPARSVPPETGKPSALETKPVEERPKEVVKPPEQKAEPKPQVKEPPPAKKKEEPPPPPVERPVTSAGGQRVVLAANGEPAPGQQFLQVVASTRPDCEIIADVLKRKGFMAVVVPGPSGAIFRVLVGPLPDAAAITKTRVELEAAGFQKPYPRKY